MALFQCSANMCIKSYLLNGKADAYTLVTVILEVVDEQRKVLEQRRGYESNHVRQNYLTRSYLGKLATRVSFKALEIISREYRHAKAAFPAKGRPRCVPLGPYNLDCAASLQCGVPCRYKIYSLLNDKKVLKLWDIHHHWHLQRSLEENDPYLRIKDPKVAQKRRGGQRICRIRCQPSHPFQLRL
jgi:hypothetical protein